MITVSDSSPFIFLAKLDYFYLLKTLFQKIFIPNQVYVDVVIKGKRRPGEKELNQAVQEGWIEVVEVKESDKVKAIIENWKVHQGEAEAIFLAKNLSAFYLLTDDDRVVSRAGSINIIPIRTPGVFLMAKTMRLIPTVKEKIDGLVRENYWMTHEEYEDILKEAKELR